MPRAKRTDRAEARRRYRATLDAVDDGTQTPDDPAGTPAAGPERGAARQGPAAAPQSRPSITHAFRAAFRPVTLRDDLRTFPALLTHRSVWLPILLTVLAGLFFVVTNGANPLVAIIATYFIAPPALGSVFLAGFLAPRSSYLIGFLVGLVSAIVASAIVLSSGQTLNPDGMGTVGTSPSPSIAASASPSAGPGATAAASASPAPSATAASSATPTPTAAATPPAGSTSRDQVIYAFLTSPPFGMFFAATAAWYRRFLKLSNPNRGRRQPVRRGPDGRARGNQRSRR